VAIYQQHNRIPPHRSYACCCAFYYPEQKKVTVFTITDCCVYWRYGMSFEVRTGYFRVSGHCLSTSDPYSFIHSLLSTLYNPSYWHCPTVIHMGTNVSERTSCLQLKNPDNGGSTLL